MSRNKPRPRVWPLQDAKNRFSQLVDDAQRGSPQFVTRRGKEAAVVISFEEYRRLAGPRGSLIDLLLRAPRVPGGLRIERSAHTGRDVDLT